MGFDLLAVDLQRNAPKAAYRHRPFPVHLRIENRRRWMSVLSVRVERANRSATPLGYIMKIPTGHAARLAVQQHLGRSRDALKASLANKKKTPRRPPS